MIRVKITSKDSPSKQTIIDMLKEWSEAKTIIETDDILGIEVLEEDE